MKKTLWIVFWSLYIFSVFAVNGPEATASQRSIIGFLPIWVVWLISPLMIPAQWFLLLRFRSSLSRNIASIKLPVVIKFIIAGLFLATVLGNNFAIYFDLYHNDIPEFWNNPILNTVVGYFGPYGGLMLGWLLLRRWFAFDYRHVFWIEGIMGALTEQNYIFPLTLLSGSIIGALVLLFHLIPVYGVPLASVWVVMPKDQLPQGGRKPGFWGYILFIVLPRVAFYLGAILYYRLLDVIFKTHYCC